MSDGNQDSPSARDQGAALMKMKKFPEAAAALRRAVTANPQDEPSWRLLGGALASSGDTAGAVSAFEKAAQIAPDSAQNHYNLAIALQNTGSLYPAKSHLEQALALNPDYEQARAALRDFSARGETLGYGMREATGEAPSPNSAAKPSLRSLDDLTPVGGSATPAEPPSAFGRGGMSDTNVPPPPMLGADYGEFVNTSGQKGDVPAELQGGWNWGAFFLDWLWLLNHNRAAWGVGLLVFYIVQQFIPFIGILGLGAKIFLGINGNRIGWQNRRFQSIDDFRACQNVWTKWGVALLIAVIVLAALVAVVLYPVFEQARRRAGGL